MFNLCSRSPVFRTCFRLENLKRPIVHQRSWDRVAGSQARFASLGDLPGRPKITTLHHERRAARHYRSLGGTIVGLPFSGSILQYVWIGIHITRNMTPHEHLDLHDREKLLLHLFRKKLQHIQSFGAAGPVSQLCLNMSEQHAYNA